MAKCYSALQAEKSARMENLKRLQECNKNNMTFKQAFSQFGVTEYNKVLKGINEKEDFSALVNWVLNKLPLFHSMDLRHKVNKELYQTIICRRAREIRVGKPMLKASHDGTIRYDWPEEITYETLDVGIITASVKRADIINVAKMEGRLLTAQQIVELENPQIDWNYQPQVESPQIKLVQTERNCWDVVLTEEERNLLGEFLDI